MLRKQPRWTFSRIATLAALVLAAGYWFTPAAQVVLAAGMTISPNFSSLPQAIVGQYWSQTFSASTVDGLSLIHISEPTRPY